MRTETLILGVLAIGLLFVFGLVAPIARVVGTIDSVQEFTIITLNACRLFDGVGEADFNTAPQSDEDAEEHLVDRTPNGASVWPSRHPEVCHAFDGPPYMENATFSPLLCIVFDSNRVGASW